MRGTFLISNGKAIYNVDSSGCHQHEKLFTSKGSGSPFCKTYLETHAREGMTASEAKECVRNAISYAIKYDGSSGGAIRVFDLREDGTMAKDFHDFYSFKK